MARTLWRFSATGWVTSALICAALALPAAGNRALSTPGGVRTLPNLALASAVLPPANPSSNTPVPGGSSYAAGCSDVVQLPPFVSSASSPDGGGYWLVGADGGVFQFGDATFHGSVPGLGVHVGNIVAMAPTPDGGGYWIVGSDGGVFSFGDATYHGSVPAMGIHVNNIVGIAPSAGGGGYWIVGSDGGVFSFGNAQFHGSAAGTGLDAPIVSVAAAPGGGGYWLAASDGGVFSYGAPFYGSAGNMDLKRPIVSIAAVPGGGGYWLVGSDGGVFSYGNAGFYGSTGNMDLARPIVSMTPTPRGGGYWLVGSDGGVFSFGAAQFQGSIPPELDEIAPPPQCDEEWLAAINSGRQAEGIGPMSLPSNWNTLSPGEQIFVAVNLERTARGEPPLVGLANVLNEDAQQGAESANDPALAPSFGGYPISNGGPGGQYQEGGIWAADSQNQGVLEAMWAWMYDDGPGGMNWSCPSSGGSGCWAHRDIILGEYTGTSNPTTMMGVGWAPGGGGWAVSETAVLADFSGSQPSESFAWSQETPYTG